MPSQRSKAILLCQYMYILYHACVNVQESGYCMNITHALLCSTICTCYIAIITVDFIVLILYSIHVANACIQQFDDNTVNEDFYSYWVL